MASFSMRDLFGGMPFLDQRFRSDEFLAAVVCVRRNHARNLGWPDKSPGEYLDPALGTEILVAHGVKRDLVGDDPSGPLRDRIAAQLVEVTRRAPAWAPLFAIPIAFKTFSSESVVSYSNFLRPQHVFLGSLSLRSDTELREQLVHEVTHIWLYMMEELSRFHHIDEKPCFSLPTGASGKNATEILSAAYVMAALRMYYLAGGEQSDRRLDKLRRYRLSCVQMVENYDGLTELGDEVLERLQRC